MNKKDQVTFSCQILCSNPSVDLTYEWIFSLKVADKSEVLRKTLSKKSSSLIDNYDYSFDYDFEILTAPCIAKNGIDDGAITSIATYTVLSKKFDGLIFKPDILSTIEFTEESTIDGDLITTTNTTTTNTTTTSTTTTTTTTTTSTFINTNSTNGTETSTSDKNLKLEIWIGITVASFIFGLVLCALVTLCVIRKFYVIHKKNSFHSGQNKARSKSLF